MKQTLIQALDEASNLAWKKLLECENKGEIDKAIQLMRVIDKLSEEKVKALGTSYNGESET